MFLGLMLFANTIVPSSEQSTRGTILGLCKPEEAHTYYDASLYLVPFEAKRLRLPFLRTEDLTQRKVLPQDQQQPMAHILQSSSQWAAKVPSFHSAPSSHPAAKVAFFYSAPSSHPAAEVPFFHSAPSSHPASKVPFFHSAPSSHPAAEAQQPKSNPSTQHSKPPFLTHQPKSILPLSILSHFLSRCSQSSILPLSNVSHRNQMPMFKTSRISPFLCPISWAQRPLRPK